MPDEFSPTSNNRHHKKEKSDDCDEILVGLASVIICTFENKKSFPTPFVRCCRVKNLGEHQQNLS